MSENLSLAPIGPEAPGSEGRPSFHQPPRRQPAPAPEPEAPAAPDPGQRLIIQETETVGQFVYTVIDRASGAVVARASREEVTRMGTRPDYAAGALISAKA
jgi:hypothetical protein